MSHITCQSERDENAQIWDCPHRSVEVLGSFEHPITGEVCQEWYTENQCGPTERVSVAKDKCTRCGKVFTY